MGSNSRLALVLCDDKVTARAVHAIVERGGFGVRRTVSVAQTIIAAQEAVPDVVVVDLPSTGIVGLGLVRSLVRLAPLSHVIVLSTFDTLRAAALEAGALELVASTDLRLLDSCLRRLAGSAGAQDAGDASCVSSEVTAGSLRTKPPSS